MDALGIASGILMADAIGSIMTPSSFSDNYYTTNIINQKEIKVKEPIKHIIKDFIDESKIHYLELANFDTKKIQLKLRDPKYPNTYMINYNDAYIDLQTPWMSLNPNQVIIDHIDKKYPSLKGESFIFISNKLLTELHNNSSEFGSIYSAIIAYFKNLLNDVWDEHEMDGHFEIKEDSVVKKGFFGTKIVKTQRQVYVKNVSKEIKLNDKGIKLHFKVDNKTNIFNVAINHKTIEDFIDSITKLQKYRLTFRMTGYNHFINGQTVCGNIRYTLLKVETQTTTKDEA